LHISKRVTAFFDNSLRPAFGAEIGSRIVRQDGRHSLIVFSPMFIIPPTLLIIGSICIGNQPYGYFGIFSNTTFEGVIHFIYGAFTVVELGAVFIIIVKSRIPQTFRRKIVIVQFYLLSSLYCKSILLQCLKRIFIVKIQIKTFIRCVSLAGVDFLTNR